jgi:Recombination endonuclease VII
MAESYNVSYMKNLRAEWKARDPEGYRVARREESRAYRAKYPGRHAHTMWKRNILLLYNLTPEKWQDLFDAQGGLCDLCGQPPDAEERLSVDHSHDTGKVRALVHKRCNLIIDYFEKYRVACDNAPDYLERHK